MKSKKILVIVLALTIALILAACGSEKPKTMSQETYDNGCRALEIMEKYNSAEISKDDADSRLDSISDQLHSEYNHIEEKYKTDNLLVSGDIVIFKAGKTYLAEDDLRETLGK